MNELAVTESELLLIAGLVSIGLGIGALYVGLQRLSPAIHVYRNDPLSVRDLVYHSGPAEITGTARGDEKGVRAPFTGTTCLAYEYEVEEYQSSGDSSSWVTLESGGDAAPFLVEDDTGRVQVDVSAAELHFTPETLELDPGEEPPERIARYIQETEDVDPQDGGFDLGIVELHTGNRQRFIERRLDIGESVHVYGAVEDAPAGEWGSNLVDARLTSDEETPLVVSDSSEEETAWRIFRSRLLWPAGGTALVLAGLLGVWFGVGHQLLATIAT